ncbi:hypothetical protein [Mycobacterium sp. M26]|uniref:hypothetical protein n=1 Tax=Mycobacterium sp. M26 TaxID=1762962 RepID=UPI00073FA815|nr:hypothetical protein [Mycobacterium sp. M26]
MTYVVAARLDEGRPAVSDTQTYVAACHAVGYGHPDLTAHGAQVLQWYGTEDGLDLEALDADGAALRMLADTAEEALRLEHDGLRQMLSAWQGESRSSAAAFIDQHCRSGAGVVEALRRAADACAWLRDTLLGIVEGKVRAAVAIDDRRAGERAQWLAAAQIVTTGAPGLEQAGELVSQQIVPYVDADIRTEWVTAMRTATTAVQSAYLDAIHRVADCSPVLFAIPDRLGPPSARPAVRTATSAPVTVPAAAPEPTLLAAPPPAAPGLGSQLGDTLGRLLPDGMGTTADPLPLDSPDSDSPDDAADSPDGETDDPKQQDDSPSEPGDEPVDEPADAAPDDSVVTPPVEEPVAEQPVPPPPADPPAASPEPEPDDEPTPCEIAADELPQVGQ